MVSSENHREIKKMLTGVCPLREFQGRTLNYSQGAQEIREVDF
jgi:hypothetical protein